MGRHRDLILKGLQELSNAGDSGRESRVTFFANGNEHWLQCTPTQITMDWPFGIGPTEDDRLKSCFGPAVQFGAWEPDSYTVFNPGCNDVNSLVAGIERAFEHLLGLGSNYALSYIVEGISPPKEPCIETWEELVTTAKKVLDALIVGLPPELRPDAIRLGYELHKRSRDNELLGQFESAPEKIRLFLEAIRENAGHDPQSFCHELETTYLHELGHSLGLGEEGLRKYGL
jgi:hypothetical protein